MSKIPFPILSFLDSDVCAVMTLIFLTNLGDWFREHLHDVEKDDKDASKPVAQHFNLPNHSKEHMSISTNAFH